MSLMVITPATRYFLLLWSQLGWFGCIYSEKYGAPVLSLVFPLVAWAVLIRSKTLTARTLTLVFALAMVGILFDATLSHFGLIRFNSESAIGIPVWLVSMWLLFTTILPILAELFKKSVVLALVAGIVAGPLTYKSGEAFDVMYLSGPLALAVYAVFWGSYFTSGLFLIRRQNAN